MSSRPLSFFLSFFLLGMLFHSCSKPELEESLTSQQTDQTLTQQTYESDLLTPENAENKARTDIDENAFSIEDGMMVFHTYEDYMNVYRALRSMGDYEATSYLKSHGFENLFSIYDDIYNQIDAIESDDEAEIYTLVESHNRYVSIKDYGPDDKEIVSTTNLPQEIIANKDFVFKVGQRVFSLTRDFKFSENIFRSCGNPHEVAYTRDEAGCQKDRRAILEGIAIMINLSGVEFNDVEHIFTIIAQRKRACIWTKYNTNIHFVGESTMTSTHEDGNVFSPPINIGIGSCQGCKVLTIVGTELVRSDAKLLDMISAQSRGTTQGIGNNFVELQCMD